MLVTNPQSSDLTYLRSQNQGKNNTSNQYVSLLSKAYNEKSTRLLFKETIRERWYLCLLLTATSVTLPRTRKQCLSGPTMRLNLFLACLGDVFFGKVNGTLGSIVVTVAR